MGCSSSVYQGVIMDKRRSSVATVSSVDALESNLGHFGSIKKRYGHPSYYKMDGYDLGLRYKVKGVMQSFFVGCSRQTGEKVTVKEFHLPFYPTDDTSIMTEVLFLTKLNHAGIPRFLELFITDTSIFCITEYVDHQRLSHCMNQLTPTDIRQIMKQLAAILTYCHERKIVLRELTPSNIVVKRLGGSNFDVKIADLSLAVEVHNSTPPALADHPLFDWSLVPFCAPELLLSQPYNTSADLWSLGVILFAMCANGKLPFDHTLDHILIKHITQAYYDCEDEVWEEVADNAKSLVESLLKLPANERLTAKDVTRNHWVVIGA
mmetsp:Transcript_43152/g.31524  ORF Transcript_43152/g.31524 Transcript_43152/m.31524 type:complete len:321 (+) Transcript_43152:77-1039(+)